MRNFKCNAILRNTHREMGDGAAVYLTSNGSATNPHAISTAPPTHWKCYIGLRTTADWKFMPGGTIA